MQHQAGDQVTARELAVAMAAGCLGVRAGRLQRMVSRRFDRALRPFGLSIPQMEILGALTLIGEPVRPTALAEVLAVERSTMSRNLAAMQAKDLIAAADRSQTGRSMTVGITETGTSTLAAAQSAWHQAQRDLLAQLGIDAVPTLDSWLSSLAV